MQKFGFLVSLIVIVFLATVKLSHQQPDGNTDAEMDRHREHRERARRRLDERRAERRSERRDPRGRPSLEDYTADLDEDMRKRHEDRMRDRDHPSHHRSDRRSKIDKKNAPPGIDDEGALYHLSQCTDKQNILRNRINRQPDKFSTAEVAEIEKDLEDYMKLEIVVAQDRQNMSKDYNKARDINDKTKRRKYLDSLKDKKDIRRDHDKKNRDIAREKYLSIKTKIENILNHGEL